jgi:hypothetical protein
MTVRGSTGRRAVLPALAAILALLWALAPQARAASSANQHVTVALRPRDPAALARYADAVSTPGSAAYGRYLTARQFGARFGASAARIDAVTAALRSRGLDAGHASAGGLSIPLSATASQLRAAGGASSAVARALSRADRAAVQSVIAFGRSAAPQPLAVRPSRRPPGGLATGDPADSNAAASTSADDAPTTTAGPQACATAAGDAAREHAYPDQAIADSYGFDSLYGVGDEGAGTTIAVYELEPDDPADIAAFQSCYHTHTAISYIHVDGGAGQGAGSDEAALDIETLIGFAPQARLLVYQGPNAQTGLPGAGPYDVFSAIINQDRAQVLSVSWGQCEQQLGAPAEKAENTLFEQAAVQGQTVVSAAGDDGAEDCDTGGPESSLRSAVDDPASQPNVVGVGGTTLQSPGPPPVEAVWNSGGPDGAGVGAGGGGVSARWGMAPDQFDTPAFLHVHRSAAVGSACGEHTAYCREVPDVSADADPATGYEIYWNGADTQPEPSGWQALGGTSASAPLWAALFALADASPACDGAPLGFVGPALYRAAAGHYAADFHDVTTGDNDFTSTNGGRWTAGPGYDLASGLGTPNAGPLVDSLCADSVRLNRPGSQSSAVRAAVGLTLNATDVRGATLTYRAAHLPPGVVVDPQTGRLSGRPRRPGRYHVLAEVRDGRGDRASERFSWTIARAPHLMPPRLIGTGSARRLQIGVDSGRHAPWLRRLRIHVPAGLVSHAAAQVMVRARGRATVGVQGSMVTVTLASPSPSVRVTIPVRGATTAPSLTVGVRAGSTGTSSLQAAFAEEPS